MASGPFGSRTEEQEQSIPQSDGGKQAWLVLAGCFVIQLPVWGAPCNSIPRDT